MAAVHTNHFNEHAITLNVAKVQVLSLLRNMKGVPEFTKYFVNDLIERANSTIQEIVRALEEREISIVKL